jgi:hypothetical protein
MTSPIGASRFGGLQALIAALAVAAAAIHFSRAFANPRITALFTLNGIGYLGLVILLYLPAAARWRSLTRRVLMGYAALTLVLYFVWGVMKGEWLALGFACVAIEALLILALWMESNQHFRRATEA